MARNRAKVTEGCVKAAKKKIALMTPLVGGKYVAAVSHKSSGGATFRYGKKSKSRTAGKNALISNAVAKKIGEFRFIKGADYKRAKRYWTTAQRQVRKNPRTTNSTVFLTAAQKIADFLVQVYRKHLNSGVSARGRLNHVQPEWAKRKRQLLGYDKPAGRLSDQMFNSMYGRSYKTTNTPRG